MILLTELAALYVVNTLSSVIAGDNLLDMNTDIPLRVRNVMSRAVATEKLTVKSFKPTDHGNQ